MNVTIALILGAYVQSGGANTPIKTNSSSTQ